MVNFGPLAAEIGPVVWGTPANFNGFAHEWSPNHHRAVFPASRFLQHISDLRSKFARPQHVWKYGRHPICEGKKKEKKERNHRAKYNDLPYFIITRNAWQSPALAHHAYRTLHALYAGRRDTPDQRWTRRVCCLRNVICNDGVPFRQYCGSVRSAQCVFCSW